MSNTLIKIINVIFISFFLLPTFSTIRLENKSKLAGKKSIDINLNKKAPINLDNGKLNGNFLQSSKSANETQTETQTQTKTQAKTQTQTQAQKNTQEAQEKKNMIQTFKDISAAKELMNIKENVEKELFPNDIFNNTNSNSNSNNNLFGYSNYQYNNNNNQQSTFDKVVQNVFNEKKQNFINKVNRKEQDFKNYEKGKIVDYITKEEGVKDLEKTKISDKIVKDVGAINLEKDKIVNKLNKHVAEFNLEKEKIKNDIRKEKDLFKDETLEKIIQEKTAGVLAKNHYLDDIIKENNARIVGVPILEISIKQKTSRTILEADGHIRREIAAHLEKEIAKDTLKKATEAKFIIEQKSEKILRKTSEELKRQIARDVIREIKHESIFEKARAAEILEKISTSEIEEKLFALKIVRKVTENFRLETQLENMKKIDAVKILDDNSILETFIDAIEFIEKLVDNQKSRKIAEEILIRANEIDLKEKKETLIAIEESIRELTRSSYEIKREIEGKEILEIATEEKVKDNCKKDIIEEHLVGNKGSKIEKIIKVDDLKKIKDMKKDSEIKKALELKEIEKAKRKTNLRRI